MLASQGAGTRAASAHPQTRNWKLQTLKRVQGSPESESKDPQHAPTVAVPGSVGR